MESGHNSSGEATTNASDSPKCQARGSCAGPRSGIRSGTYVLGSVLCCTLAMFIWMKLRVVTNVPRTAYAEPESKQLDGNAAASKTLAVPAGAQLSDGASGSPTFERP